jgi:hypothetical protein
MSDNAGLLSRKFLITGATIVLTTCLALVQKLTGEVASVFTAAIVAYNGANAATHYAQSRQANSRLSKEASVEDAKSVS